MTSFTQMGRPSSSASYDAIKAGKGLKGNHSAASDPRLEVRIAVFLGKGLGLEELFQLYVATTPSRSSYS